MLKKLGISLFSASCLLLLGLKLYLDLENKNHFKIVKKNLFRGTYNTTKYIGYIEIEELSIKRGIVQGINDYILNDNDIGSIIDDSIILAGHAVSNVFGNLKYVETGQFIYIYLYNELYRYRVVKKVISDKTDLTYLNDELVLITCTNDDKRLLVLAKKDE